MKDVFIQGSGVISPQRTLNEEVFIDGFMYSQGNRKFCIEPDYSQLIDPKQIRRMSRIIRMSVASSITALKNSGIDKPEAVIVGTAFGCLDDTYAFLSKLVQFKEDMLSPTAFIHSTHNTIAAQIALHYKCYGYNSTYVHRSVSFESALSDAVMMIEADELNNILVGGADEIIDAGFTIMERLGHFKKNENVTSENSFDSGTTGTIAGEGTAFFVLGNKHSQNCYAKIKAVESWSHISPEIASANIQKLIAGHKLNSSDIILTGLNGDKNEDAVTMSISSSLTPGMQTFNFKHLSGEYGTATSFATWMAANMLKKQVVPGLTGFEKNKGAEFNKILICNQVNKLHYSVILLESC